MYRLINDLYIQQTYTSFISTSSWNYDSSNRIYYYVLSYDFYILGENQNYIKMKLELNNSINSITSWLAFNYWTNVSNKSIEEYHATTNTSGDTVMTFDLLTPDYRHIDGSYCISNYSLIISFENSNAVSLSSYATIKCGESSMPTF